MLECSEEGLGAAEEGLGIVYLGSREPPLDEIHGLRGQGDAGFDVVDEVDLAVGVGSVDVRKFNGGPGVAAIEEDGQASARVHGGDESSVEGVRVDLAGAFEVDGANGVVESRREG